LSEYLPSAPSLILISLSLSLSLSINPNLIVFEA